MKQIKLLTLLAAVVCAANMGAQNVAKVGSTEYASFATALSNWTNGTTLQLLADIEYAAPITVDNKTVTLDLNGHGIRHTGVEGLFCVVNGGNLTLNDSDPTTEHKFSIGENGFATLNEASGTLTINGGYLTGGIGCNNTAYLRTAEYKDGGAFFIYNGSTVTMNGGTLIGNGEAANSRTGGAVFIARNGHFILNGGTITRNRARFGGGISLYGGRTSADIATQAPSVLEIHGGEISYNYAFGNSAGVHTNGYTCQETLIITGGSIINNIVPADAKAAGIYVEHANTTLYLSGNPVIKDNLRGTYQENIRIKTGTIHVNGALTNMEPIHVFMETVGVFTTGLSTYGNASNFASDNSGYGVKTNGSGEAQLAQPAGLSAAPTAISGLVYNGNAQALVNAGTATNGTMKYSLNNSTWSASIPSATNADDYTVYYMVEGDATHADFIPSSNTVAVKIDKADVSYTAPEAITGLEYTGAAQTLITAGSATGGEMQYKLNDGAWSISLPTATDANDYTVWYKVVGDANHNDVAEASIAVSIAAPSDFDIHANLDPQNAGVYYSTFYHSAADFTLPAGVEAYKAVISGDALNLTKVAVAGQTIPANNAVILKSTVQNYTLAVSAATSSTYDNNSLQGSDVAMATPTNCYVLSGEGGVVGFYQYSAANLKAHKAYVIYSGASLAPKRLRFVFNQEQTTTDIEGIQPSDVRSQKVIENGVLYIIKNGVRYNAQGQIVK